ncbi:MAG: putative glycosyltransferase EpsD [Firmicutes bacterium ADurb.Bin193]|nr:MAG: putative glycosyltransferase EpsD [Firmicutes bacterium ADurb.Bin193]
MNKILIVSNLDGFHKNFHLPYIKELHMRGWQVDLASRGDSEFEFVNNKFNICFTRKPFSLSNLKALFSLREIIKRGDYSIIFCNTPIPGAISRIAAIGTKNKHAKVIYSAHGYSFYSGGSLFWNTFYRFVEKALSYFTDTIITMNREDYDNSLKYKFHGRIVNVNGVGIVLDKFRPADRAEKLALRVKKGYSENDLILIYPAELTQRKNQIMLIDVMEVLTKEINNVKLLLVGSGILEETYKEEIKKRKLDNYIELLGFREDVPDLLKMSDMLIASSLTEGLPINVIEAMATGLPVVATRARGHEDLIVHGENGFVFERDDIKTAAEYIRNLYENQELYDKLRKNTIESAQKYDVKDVMSEYLELLDIKVL